MHTTHHTGDRGTASRKLGLARQWAKDIHADRETLSQDTIDAAADLILSLPDHWIAAEELQEVIEEHDPYESGALIDDLRALLTPPPLTLAEMEPEEAAGYIGKNVSIIDYPETGPHMVLAIRGELAMILMHHPTRAWPSTDIWPLDELTPTEPGQEQDPKAAGPRSYPQAGQAGYRPPHNRY